MNNLYEIINVYDKDKPITFKKFDLFIKNSSGYDVRRRLQLVALSVVVNPKKSDKSAIISIFDKIDKDHSGTIEENELEMLFEDIGIPLDKKDVKELFRILDVDNSGKIGYSELKNEIMGYMDGGKALVDISNIIINELKVRKIEEISEMFESKCDDNMCIGKNEILDILTRNGSRISAEDFDSFIGYIDFDGDGNISLAELEFIFNKGIERNKFVDSVDMSRRNDEMGESKMIDKEDRAARSSFYDSKRDEGSKSPRVSKFSESKMEETKS